MNRKLEVNSIAPPASTAATTSVPAEAAKHLLEHSACSFVVDVRGSTPRAARMRRKALWRPACRTLAWRGPTVLQTCRSPHSESMNALH